MIDPLPLYLARIALALLFGLAAWHKLRAPRRFAATVEAYALLPRFAALPVALGLGALEAALVAGLLAPALAPSAASAGAALLVLYSVAIAVNLARGRRDLDCGCLGPGHRQPVSGWLLGRNAVLVAAAVLAAQIPTARAVTPIDVGSGLAALPVLVLLFHAAQQLVATGPRLTPLRRSS